MIGQNITHYRITEKLGEGGMGVVYKAEDTKLARTVALKFLGAHLLGDPEAKQRFLREAQAAAALNHPNICTVYEIDEANDKTFIAMAFVEGESLEDRIARGPLPIKDALDIAQQIAKGLQAAHNKGIIHRDIKPANLLIASDGPVTIMDFGLARLTEASRLTRADTTMGTVAYMSPEQAQGGDVDHRSDIWALGCVLYEMICGQRPFRGQYDQALFYEIVNQEPEPLTSVRAGVPMELEFIVGKCLAKDADSRYQTAGEMAVDLKNLQEKLKSGRSAILKTSAMPLGEPAASGPAPGAWAQPATLPPSAAMAARPVWKRSLPWPVAAILAVALAAVAFLHLREGPPPELPLRRFAYTPPADISVESVFLSGDVAGWATNLAVSPNGKHIAFATATREGTNRQLWVQDLDQPQPRVIAEGDSLVAPFWSPGSDFIGFGTGSAELRRVSVQGGPSSLVCKLPGPFFGGTWSADGGLIVFSASTSGGPSSGVLHEVPAGGGAAKPLSLPAVSEAPAGRPEDLNWPHFLPAEAGSRVLVYANATSGPEQILIVHDLATGRREVLGPGAFPVYSPSGHLVFQASRTTFSLLAAPFSLKSLQFTGAPFPLRENAGYPSVAGDGTLVYLESSGARMKQMVWRDRSGTKTGTIGQPQLNLEMPELSPDGRRVLVRSTETGNYDIWVHEVARGVKQRLSFDPAAEDRPMWLPKGDRISFSSARRGEGGQDIYLQSADGTGEAQLLVASPTNEFAYDWSAEEKHLIFTQFHTTPDLFYLQRKDDGSGYDSVPFTTSSFDKLSPKLSPDGKFVAYESNESGGYEVYVQPFPQGGGKVRVSGNGGHQPRWRGDGNELFYVEGNALVAVPVTTLGGFSAGEPQRLFEAAPAAFEGRGQRYTVTPDGQKFIIVEDVESDATTAPAIQVTQNWFAEFQGRASAR